MAGSVPGSVNRMTDDWMQERNQAPLDKMKDWVKNCARELGAPLVDAMQDRIGVAKAGKQLLDDGGEAAELGVLAKKVAIDAVAIDQDIIDKVYNAAILYKEAASLLQSQTSGLGVLGRLVEMYAERAKMYSQMYEALGETPQEPPLSDVEWDAIKLVQLRQFKANLGLREHVGGAKAGRHGYSFFNCIEREDRTQRVAARPQVTAGAEWPGCREEAPTPSNSQPPSVFDCSFDAGASSHDLGQMHASNPPQAYDLQHSAHFGTSSHTSVGSSTSFGKRPAGGTMASIIESMGKSEQDFESTQNSQTLPRGDTLDTLNTCIDSLDNLRTVIDTMDAPVMQSHNSQMLMQPDGEDASKAPSRTMSDTAAPKPLSPRSYASKDAERQANSRRLLQETRQTMPPTSTPPDASHSTSANMATMPSEARSRSSTPPPSDTGNVASRASFTLADLEAASSTVGRGTPPRVSPNVVHQGSFAIAGPALTASGVSNESSVMELRPYGNYGDLIDVPPKASQNTKVGSEASLPGPYPGLNTFTSVRSYPMGMPLESFAASANPPAGVCPYRVNDPVEIFSKSSDTWVKGSVVKVSGWVLTVQYGDRERKVDLNGDDLSSFFRSAQQHAMTQPAPAFDSMLTNAGGPKFVPDSALSVEPRHIKAAVL